LRSCLVRLWPDAKAAEAPARPAAGDHRPTTVAQCPSRQALVRRVGAILLEQNDEWAVQRARYMTPETMATLRDDPVVGLPAIFI
jgi:hypothetical protein